MPVHPGCLIYAAWPGPPNDVLYLTAKLGFERLACKILKKSILNTYYYIIIANLNIIVVFIIVLSNNILGLYR